MSHDIPREEYYLSESPWCGGRQLLSSGSRTLVFLLRLTVLSSNYVSYMTYKGSSCDHHGTFGKFMINPDQLTWHQGVQFLNICQTSRLHFDSVVLLVAAVKGWEGGSVDVPCTWKAALRVSYSPGNPWPSISWHCTYSYKPVRRVWSTLQVALETWLAVQLYGMAVGLCGVQGKGSGHWLTWGSLCLGCFPVISGCSIWSLRDQEATPSLSVSFNSTGTLSNSLPSPLLLPSSPLPFPPFFPIAPIFEKEFGYVA